MSFTEFIRLLIPFGVIISLVTRQVSSRSTDHQGKSVADVWEKTEPSVHVSFPVRALEAGYRVGLASSGYW